MNLKKTIKHESNDLIMAVGLTLLTMVVMLVPLFIVVIMPQPLRIVVAIVLLFVGIYKIIIFNKGGGKK